MYNKNRNSGHREFRPATHRKWRPIEKCVRNGVVVEVNELPLAVPKYSFSLSAAKTDEGGQILDMNRHLPMNFVPSVVEMLQSLHDKYMAIRATKQKEFDSRVREDHDDDDDFDIRD